MVNLHLPPIFSWSTSQIIAATILVIGIGAGFWLLFNVGWIVFVFFIAIIIGTALKPATDWFRQRGFSRIGSTIIVFLIVLLVLIALLVFLLPPLVEQTILLAADIPTYYGWLRGKLVNSSNLFLQQISWQLPATLSVNLPIQPGETEAPDAAGGSFTNLLLFFKAVFMTTVTLMLSFYWILDGQRALQTLYLIVPIRHRDDARALVNAVEAKVGAYIKGQIILCSIVGVMALVAYLIIGLPNALALGLFAGIMELVPVIGPMIGAVPAMVLALSMGFEEVVWVIVATIIIQQLENAVILPRVMDKSVGVHPFVTLIAFFTLGSVLGVLGAILAVPIAAIVQLFIDRLRSEVNLTELTTLSSRTEIGLLQYEVRELMQDIRKLTRQVNTQPNGENKYFEDELESIANELASLLAQIEPAEATR